MDASLITWLFFGGGLLLLLSEAVVPGMVVGFFGIGAMITAGLRALGLIDSVPVSLVTWMASSGALVVGLRQVAQKWLPSETSKADVDEARNALGTVVEVLEDIPEVGTGKEGRIRFEGTSWSAQSTEGTIKKGGRARLVVRENLVWVVEPVLSLGEGDEESVDEKLANTETVAAER